MQNLTRAHDELFRRHPDERFESLPDLSEHCQQMKRWSAVQWVHPAEFWVEPADHALTIQAHGRPLSLTDWSFTQLCSLARVNKDTVNKLSPETATRVFVETWPTGAKPLQVFAAEDVVRSLHQASYTRLYNADLLTVISEFAVDFQPPQNARTDPSEGDAAPPATGLYCGEQDMFCFLIDPTGWIEIDGEAFAPGFFVWNSEVGRRTLGIQTFWFQAVCQNHIVWDATEVCEYTRKHTTNVHEALSNIQQMLARLVDMRDQRRDSFATVIKKAMSTMLGDKTEDVMEVLRKHGIQKAVAEHALKIAQCRGKFTIFSVVDALTQMAAQEPNAGDRTEADVRASTLLALAA
jgi:predicted GNAT family acetyltransferase